MHPSTRLAWFGLCLAVATLAGNTGRAAELTPQQQKQVAAAERLKMEGAALTAAGKSQEALLLAKEELALLDQVYGTLHLRALDCLQRTGDLHQSLHDYLSAKAAFSRVLQISIREHGKHHPRTLQSIRALGNALNDNAEYEAALSAFQLELEIRQKFHASGQVEIAEVQQNIGNAYSSLGRYDEAFKLLGEAQLILVKEFGENHSHTGTGLHNIGLVLLDKGDLAHARQFLEKGLEIRRRVLGENHLQVGASYNALGKLQFRQGNRVQARRLFESSLVILENSGGKDHPHTAVGHRNLAVVLRELNENAEAEAHLEKALAIDRKVFGNNSEAVADGLHGMADLLRRRGELATAQAHLEQALRIKRELLGSEHPSTGATISVLGEVLDAAGKSDEAIACFTEALKISKARKGDIHGGTIICRNDLIDLQIRQENWDSATQLMIENRTAIHRHNASVLPALSESEQLTYLQQYDDRSLDLGLSLVLLRRTDARIRDLGLEWVLNRKGIAQRTFASRAQQAGIQSKPEVAALSKELNERRTELAQLSLRNVPADMRKEHEQQVAELQDKVDHLNRRLQDTMGYFFAAPAWVTLAEVRAEIPAKSVLIEVVLLRPRPFLDFGDEGKQPRYVAWIIPAEGEGEITFTDLGPADVLHRLVADTRKQISAANDPEGTFRKEGESAAAEEVKKAFLAMQSLVGDKIAGRLPESTEKLIISPDGALWLFPWAAMPVGENDYLVEYYAIRFVGCGRDLTETRKQEQATLQRPILFADPDFDMTADATRQSIQAIFPNERLSADSVRGLLPQASLPKVLRLPGTKLEADAVTPSIAKMGGAAPVAYTGRYALESVMKKVRRPSVLMLSTHGYFLADSSESLTVAARPATHNPLLGCGLLLAGCNSRQSVAGDDGVLTGLEITALDLQGTELVVLSACETGVGKVNFGESVSGLRLAFQLAGARSVVSTLWQVPDRDSALLMNDFFAELAAGKPKDEALQLAQIKRIHARRKRYDAAHPFYWAAWTVTGN